MADLYDLVNSFIEKGYGVVVDGEIRKFDYDRNSDDDDDDDEDIEEMKDSLKMLFAFDQNGDEIRRKLTVAVRKAWRRVIGDGSSPPPSPDFKRRLMVQLRDQGFDAGICKSKWGKNGKLPSGCYEYVDINFSGTRYIINVLLVGEFEIARPSENYVSLLDVFPQISVCKAETLKRIVRIMCDAMKISMNQKQMSVPPWRRYAYNHNKWFGSYKRITEDEFPTKPVADKRASSNEVVRVLSFSGRSCYRREEFGGKNFCLKVGNLAMVMNEAS